MSDIVHIVDDEEAIRDSLAWLMSSADLESRTWDSGEAFLAGATIVTPACIILDMRMTGLDGLAVFQELRNRGSDVPVIFLTGHADVPLAVEALKRGAFDFVEKPFNDQRLVDVVREALGHHVQVSAAAVSRAKTTAALASLSPRERQVLNLMVQGQMNKQIAAALDLAVRTVEVHRAHVLEKFGLRSVAELAGLLARLDETQ